MEEVKQKYPQNTNQQKLDYTYNLGRLATVYADLGRLENASDYQDFVVDYYNDNIKILTELLPATDLNQPQHHVYEQLGANYVYLAGVYWDSGEYSKAKKNMILV